MKKFILFLLIFTISCTGYRAFKSGQDAEKIKDYDKAVAEYLSALAKDPENIKYKIYLERAKLRASQTHFENGKKLHQAKQYPGAILEYQIAVQLDPTNQFAAQELVKAQKEYELLRASETEIEKAKEEAKKAKAQPPKLNPKSKKPMSFSFPKPTEFMEICKAVAKGFGFNVIFDPQMKEKKVTIELQDVTPEAALNALMQAGGTFYKVMDPMTIIIVPDTPQNRKTYEDLVIKTYYLSNGDVKDVTNVLRSIIQTKNLGQNNQLNAIVIRDSADKVELATKIIEANDKAKAEVLLNVELLQVDSQKVKQIGTELGAYTFTTNFHGYPEGRTDMSLDDLKISTWMWGMTIPSITYYLVKNITEAELLAQPQLRISEGEKASLHIGDRIPIVTASFSTYAGGGTTGYYYPYNSYQYIDVGIKIDIKPRIHHNREVTLELKVEVSSISGEVSVGEKQTAPKISTRTIQSVIRLKDGETNLLAGLLRSDKTTGRTGFPWLQDIPLIGNLFSKFSKTENRTDLILTITPQIIKMPDITEEDLLPIWAGTEENITYKGSGSKVESGVPSPFEGEGEVEEKPENPQEEERPLRQPPDQRPTLPQKPGGGGVQRFKPMGGNVSELPSFYLNPPVLLGSLNDTVSLNLEGDFEGFVESTLVLSFNPAELQFLGISPYPGVEVEYQLLENSKIKLNIKLPSQEIQLASLKFKILSENGAGIKIEDGSAYDQKGNIWPIEANEVSIKNGTFK
ncbi:MAG: secretin N-terminal domain-containing protein [Thermoanaerobaculia bacterium]